MDKQDVYYRSGRVAKICGVAQRTVGTWFDKGYLKGHKLPGTGSGRQDRRISERGLVEFLQKQGLDRGAVPKESFLTTGEAADACKVSPRTVAKWCENGLVDHYKFPTTNRGGQDRRISEPDLIRLLRDNGYKGNSLPIDGFLTTGEAAEIFSCSDKHIVNLYDTGKLEGYQIPLSRDRRISKTSFRELLINNQMYVPASALTKYGIAPVEEAIEEDKSKIKEAV